MTVYPNPVPVLIDNFGHTLTSIRRVLDRRSSAAMMQSLYRSRALSIREHNRLFPLSMVEWGAATYDFRLFDRSRRNLLWKVYFPETRPHIYHYMAYVHSWDLTEATGYSQRVIEGILRQPRLHLRQRERITEAVVPFINDLSSPARLRGPDPRYMSLYRAFHDTARLYAKGEIVAD